MSTTTSQFQTKPDYFNSIEENEKFTVVEEIEGWYRVSTGNGTGGWLPKTSVKKTD